MDLWSRNGICLHCQAFPHFWSAFYRTAGGETGVVICGKPAVTWFVASTNQRHSAFLIPHFTFRIPHCAIPHFTHSREIISHFRLGTGPVRSGVARFGPVRSGAVNSHTRFRPLRWILDVVKCGCADMRIADVRSGKMRIKMRTLNADMCVKCGLQMKIAAW